MSMQEIKKGKKIIEKIFITEAGNKNLLIEKCYWLPFDIDKREIKLEYKINGKKYKYTVSRENLTDCINDKSIYRILSNEIKKQLARH